MIGIESIIGWVITIAIVLFSLWRSSKNNADTKKEVSSKAAEVARDEVNRILAKMTNEFDDLPCVRNKQYEFNQGQMLQRVTGLEESQTRIEGQLQKLVDRGLRT